METLIYSTPYQDVKELNRYLGDLNWMGQGLPTTGMEDAPGRE